jgi:hypothetical protein
MNGKTPQHPARPALHHHEENNEIPSERIRKAVKSLVVNPFRRNRVAVYQEIVTVGTTPRPKARFRLVRRMAMAAYMNASRAVNAGISRAEHQTHRLRVYLKNPPHVDYPIPEMRIGDDDQLVFGWPKDRRHTIERALDEGESIEGVDALAGGARREHDRASEEHAKTIARIAELDAHPYLRGLCDHKRRSRRCITDNPQCARAELEEIMRRDSHMKTQRKLQFVTPTDNRFLYMIWFCKIRTARYIRPAAVRAELTNAALMSWWDALLLDELVAASGVPYDRARFRRDRPYRGAIVRALASALRWKVPVNPAPVPFEL